jgi:hypothetical protein
MGYSTQTAMLGRIIVTIAFVVFGLMLFRGMLFEWHRREGEMGGKQ